MKIWVPKFKIAEPKSPITVGGGLTGHYTMRVIRNGVIRRELSFPNVITNLGLNRLGTNAGVLSSCAVGTGTGTPNVNDTSLGNQLATSDSTPDTVRATQGEPPYYAMKRRTYQFDAGTATGNLTEVGVGWSGNPLNLFSRSLILDGEGSPTTLTVLEDEILQVVYEVRLIPPTDDVEDSATIGGESYDYTMRAANVTSSSTTSGWAVSASNIEVFLGRPNTSALSHQAFDGAIGAITSAPSGSSSNGSLDEGTYGDNDLFRDYSVTWGLGSGNFGGGIQSIRTGMLSAGSVAFQIGFSPEIPKTDEQVFTANFRVTWSQAS